MALGSTIAFILEPPNCFETICFSSLIPNHFYTRLPYRLKLAQLDGIRIRPQEKRALLRIGRNGGGGRKGRKGKEGKLRSWLELLHELPCCRFSPLDHLA